MRNIDPYLLAASLLKERVTGKRVHLFFPELIDKRIKEATSLKDEPEKAYSWRRQHTTLSLSSSGMTKKGNPVVAFVHEPHYLSIPENLVKVPDSLNQKTKVYYTAPLPSEEWENILQKDGSGKVFVTDFKEYRKLAYHLEKNDWKISSIGKLEEIIKNPIIYGIFGGNKTRIQKYLRLKKKPFIPRKMLFLELRGAFDTPLASLICTEKDYSPSAYYGDNGIVEGSFQIPYDI